MKNEKAKIKKVIKATDIPALKFQEKSKEKAALPYIRNQHDRTWPRTYTPSGQKEMQLYKKCEKTGKPVKDKIVNIFEEVQRNKRSMKEIIENSLRGVGTRQVTEDNYGDISQLPDNYLDMVNFYKKNATKLREFEQMVMKLETEKKEEIKHEKQTEPSTPSPSRPE